MTILVYTAVRVKSVQGEPTGTFTKERNPAWSESKTAPQNPLVDRSALVQRIRVLGLWRQSIICHAKQQESHIQSR